jgi:hypothetical protein
MLFSLAFLPLGLKCFARNPSGFAKPVHSSFANHVAGQPELVFGPPDDQDRTARPVIEGSPIWLIRRLL